MKSKSILSQLLIAFIAALIFITLTVPAYAGSIATSLNGGTNAIAATTTNAFGTGVKLTVPTDSRVITVQLTGGLTGAGTSAVTAFLDKSIDDTYFVTQTNFSFTASGTATNTALLDLDTGGARFYRVRIGNANASPGTNLTVKAWGKPGL